MIFIYGRIVVIQGAHCKNLLLGQQQQKFISFACQLHFIITYFKTFYDLCFVITIVNKVLRILINCDRINIYLNVNYVF